MNTIWALHYGVWYKHLWPVPPFSPINVLDLLSCPNFYRLHYTVKFLVTMTGAPISLQHTHKRSTMAFGLLIENLSRSISLQVCQTVFCSYLLGSGHFVIEISVLVLQVKGWAGCVTGGKASLKESYFAGLHHGQLCQQ